MRFDLNEKGLRRIFRDWQIQVLEYIWEVNVPVTSGVVWKALDEIGVTTDKNSYRPVSRASIINFLNQMVDEKLMTFELESGKGGYHRVYRLVLRSATKNQFKNYLHARFTGALNKFLEEE